MKADDLDENCPVCCSSRSSLWYTERGFDLHRCSECRFLFIKPMPKKTEVANAVQTGYYSHLNLDVRAHRRPGKVGKYSVLIRELIPEIAGATTPIKWVDVGCGYGELLEAAAAVLPENSEVVGVEPMFHKAESASARGLTVVNSYLEEGTYSADVISMMDIFSHIPDFKSLLRIAASNLNPGGLLVIETGNLADVERRVEFPGELGLPDHLAFGGENHLTRMLNEAGFSVLRVMRIRIDGILEFLKILVKKIIGRPVSIRLPYTSSYRQVLFVARKV